MEWTKVFYNDLETNVEVTKCGRVRKVRTNWEKNKTKIDEVDFSKLKLKNGYKRVGIKVNCLKIKHIKVHQLVSAAFLDYKFNGHDFVIDHIDSDKLNNHVDNLRIVTQRENNSKERTLKSGLPVGVDFDKNAKKYRARIRINEKRIYLGLYNTPEEASNAYQNKLKEIKI